MARKKRRTGNAGCPNREPRAAGNEEEAPTSPFEVGVLGVAATGEASPRQTYGEGAFVTPAQDSISCGDSVRVGPDGDTFGEALTGEGTARPGSTGGGPARVGSPGSTHDVGVRGPGTVGEGRPRLERWGGPTRRQPGTEPFPSGAAVNEAVYHSAFSYGWEMAEKPEYRGRDWQQLEPELRRSWERLYPDIPWEEAANAIYDGWAESPVTAESRTEAESYQLPE